MTDRRAPVDRWESVFADGLVAAERLTPWVDGVVHVVRGLPDQPEPVPTGRLDAHQLIVPLTTFRVTEHEATAAPYWDYDWTPGEVAVLSRDLALADVRTSWRCLSGARFGIVSVLVPPATVAEACRAAGLDYGRTEFHDRHPAADPVLDALVRALGQEAEGGGARGRLYAEQVVATLAAHLVADYAESRVPKAAGGALDAARLRRVLDHVEAHLASDLSLDDLARVAALSPYHFARAFKKSVGVPPYRYVVRRRVERARDLIATGQYRVGEVAHALGFSDPSHLTRAFKAHLGLTPSRYLRESRR